jgi:hypothetical protein
MKCPDLPQLKHPVEELGKAGNRVPGAPGCFGVVGALLGRIIIGCLKEMKVDEKKGDFGLRVESQTVVSSPGPD